MVPLDATEHSVSPTLGLGISEARNSEERFASSPVQIGPAATGADIDAQIRSRLTERQALVLSFINEYRRERGRPPTLREIGARLGIRSTNGVNDHLLALERKGYLQRETFTARGVRVTPRADDEREGLAAERAGTRAEVTRLRSLLRRLYAAARTREPWRLDSVAAAISADFAEHGEPL